MIDSNNPRDQVEQKGGLLVVSGPSGSGKTTICRQLSRYNDVTLAVSATTRPMRPDEVNGKDYYFLTHEDFINRVNKSEFVEYNEVFKNKILYGSLRSEMKKGLADPTRYLLMEIDVKGGLNIKSQYSEGIYLFIKPPSLEELSKRLSKRGTEKTVDIKNRLSIAEWEIEQSRHYDKIIVNNDIETAISEIVEYLKIEQDG